MIPFSLKLALARSVGRLVDLNRRVARTNGRYVIAYHRVISPEVAARDHVHSAMWISPATFDRQLRWMKTVGDIVDYRQLLDPQARSDRARFALTFDDGWLDNYTEAAPILRRHSASALIFVVTGAIEQGGLFWPEDVVTKTHHARLEANRILEALRSAWPGPERLPEGLSSPGSAAEAWVEALKLVAEPDRKARIAAYYDAIGAPRAPLAGFLMSWEQIRELKAAGVQFGSHTHSHRILKHAPLQEIEEEVTRSRAVLADRLGVAPDAFCYPNARYDGREAAVIAQAGYQYAFCLDGRTVADSVDPFLIPRFLMSERLASDADYCRMYLLEAPGFRATPHNPRGTP